MVRINSQRTIIISYILNLIYQIVIYINISNLNCKMNNPIPQGPIQMPDLDYPQLQEPPRVDNDLLLKIDNNIKGANWIDSHQCITVLRQICKFNPNFIPDVVNRYSNVMLDLFSNGKTQIIKNLLRLVKEIFDAGQVVNVQKAVYAFLPILLKKSSNDIGHIKQMSQLVLTSFSNNCGYQISFVISSVYCCDKNLQIAEISIKLLARLIENIGQGIMQISPESLQKLMKVLSTLIDGKRQNLSKSSLDICMYIYNLIGSENYLSLMNYSLEPNQIQSMGCAMQTHRVDTKEKLPPLSIVKKVRKSQLIQAEQMGNQNMNYNGGQQNYWNQGQHGYPGYNGMR